MPHQRIPKELESALGVLGDFIRQLNISTEQVEPTFPYIMFSDEFLGGLAMNGEDARNYRRVLSKIIEITTATEVMSKKWVEKQVQHAILASLDLVNLQKNVALDSRIEDSLLELANSLKQEPQDFQVYFPVGGIALDGLPFQFGSVMFKALNENEIEELVARSTLPGVSDLEKNNAHRFITDTLDDNETRKRALAIVKVSSVDNEAARTLALQEIRLAVDGLSFFSDIVPYAGNSPYIFGERGFTSVTLFDYKVAEPSSLAFSIHSVGPQIPLKLRTLESYNIQSPIGFDKVSDILQQLPNRRTKLQKGFLASIQWAGRATAEPRQEEAFLLYMIALESLVLMDRDRAELNYRLSLRVAHLLGIDTSSRIKISKDLRELYGIRSRIVHNGDYQISAANLALIRAITKNCIIALLTSEPFCSMENEGQITAWFDEQILSS